MRKRAPSEAATHGGGGVSQQVEEFEYKKWLRQGTLQSQRVELVKLRGQRVLMQKQLLEIPLQLAKAKDPAAHAASGLVFLSRMQSSNWSGNVERAVNVGEYGIVGNKLQ